MSSGARRCRPELRHGRRPPGLRSLVDLLPSPSSLRSSAAGGSTRPPPGPPTVPPRSASDPPPAREKLCSPRLHVQGAPPRLHRRRSRRRGPLPSASVVAGERVRRRFVAPERDRRPSEGREAPPNGREQGKGSRRHRELHLREEGEGADRSCSAHVGLLTAVASRRRRMSAGREVGAPEPQPPPWSAESMAPSRRRCRGRRCLEAAEPSRALELKAAHDSAPRSTCGASLRVGASSREGRSQGHRRAPPWEGVARFAHGSLSSRVGTSSRARVREEGLRRPCSSTTVAGGRHRRAEEPCGQPLRPDLAGGGAPRRAGG
jgi:hypothetical protein